MKIEAKLWPLESEQGNKEIWHSASFTWYEPYSILTKYYQGKHSGEASWRLKKNCSLQRMNKFFKISDLLT